MNIITLFSILLLSVASFATDKDKARELTISSFFYNGADVRSAELCGHLTGTVTFQDRIEVISDPESGSNSGYYNTVPSTNGNFCIVIRTMTGVAEAVHKPFRPGGSVAKSRAKALAAKINN